MTMMIRIIDLLMTLLTGNQAFNTGMNLPTLPNISSVTSKTNT